MTTNFPTSLDAFTNPSATDAMDSVTVPHATQHADLNDAVEALQAKVGVDGSAVTTSLDYKVTDRAMGLVGQNRLSGNLSIPSSGAAISVTFNADPNRAYVAIVGFTIYYLSGATSAYCDTYVDFNGTTYGRCTQGLDTSQPNNTGFIATEPAYGFSGSTTATVGWYKSAGNLYINGAGTYNYSYIQVYDVGAA